MLEWLRKLRSPPLRDLAFLDTDMHAHWLPGIDDGAKDMTESLAMIREFKALGYRRLIATPHIMSDIYPNVPDTIRQQLREVREACRVEGIDIQLDTAAEYLVDEQLEDHLRKYGPLTVGSDNSLLIEFGFYQPPLDLDAILFRLSTQGYRLILAHPERYPYYHRELDRLAGFRDKGIRLQVNLLSLLGHYGKSVQRTAEHLLKMNLVDFLATDAHSVHHLSKLRSGLGRGNLGYLLGGATFTNSVT
jgi:tyrosine-protein phosphatase YwqE